jgi:hypothetical protein
VDIANLDVAESETCPQEIAPASTSSQNRLYRRVSPRLKSMIFRLACFAGYRGLSPSFGELGVLVRVRDNLGGHPNPAIRGHRYLEKDDLVRLAQQTEKWRSGEEATRLVAPRVDRFWRLGLQAPDIHRWQSRAESSSRRPKWWDH